MSVPSPNPEPPAHSAAETSILAPFRHRIFLAVWTAALISNLGGMIQSVGAAWTMTSITSSADMVALVQSSTTLPIMLFALAAGALADIYERRTVMMAAQVLMLAVSVLLAVLSYLHMITPWTLLGLTFLLGCGTALQGPAWQASVGMLVPREDVPHAVALNGLGFNIARSVGPAIGGVIVSAAGVSATFLVNAVSYLALIGVLARWRPPVVENPLPREELVQAMGAGARYAWLSPSIRSVLIRGLALGLTGSAVWALMPLVARITLRGGPTTYGLILGGFGVGAVIGAIGGAAFRRRLPSEHLVRLAVGGFGAAALVVAFSPYKLLTLAALFVAGAGWTSSMSTFNITMQLSAPRWVVGRTAALLQMATFGGMAVGSWIWGTAAQIMGLPAALAIAGGLMIATVGLGLRRPLPSNQTIDLNPRQLSTLPMQGPPDPSHGAVIVTVEYRIDQADVPAFVAAMAERRRIRRRDGARRWTLLQDLANPEIWLERFHAPSWIDYLRQRNRWTVADREIDERVRAFHRGVDPPAVRRLLERTSEAMTLASEERLSEPSANLSDPRSP